MEKKAIKLGVIGCGRGLDVVKQVVKEETIIVRAICDRNPKRLQEAKKELEEKGVADLLVFDNLEAMLASDIDALYIATDATCHVPYAIQAMEAGKHVLSEIPTVGSLEEAKQLKAAVKAHPEVKYMAGENCCFWAFIETWKKMFEDGKFGDAVYAEAEYFHAEDLGEIRDLPEDHWHNAEWRRSYNAIYYLTHDLGPLLYIMNDKCKTVTCLEPSIRYDPRRTGAETGVALIKTEKGAVIRILICFGAYVGFDHNYRLMGTKGMAQTDANKHFLDAHTFAKFEDIPGTIGQMIDIPVTTKLPNEETDGHGGADKKMMKAFAKCILEDTEPPLNVDLGIHMALPGILAHESALRGGEPIEIPEI